MARFNLALEDELSELLNTKVPRGIRSQFCRSVLAMALRAVEDHGPGIIGLVVAGDVAITPSSDCQNLATTGKVDQDAKRANLRTD